MKYEIMLKILFELLSKKTVKASYLADKYEVSIRSIHRYIQCLEFAGVPIYTTRGNNGGFSVVDTFRLPSTFMTKTEFDQVINALSGIIEGIPNKHIENVINKLKSNIRNEYSNLNIQSGSLVIDAGPWGDSVGYKSKLLVIQKSIDGCKKLLINYHDRNGEVTSRIIEPHVIVFKQGLWYVYAFCHLRNEFRFFKTGRIEHATLLDEEFVMQKLSNKDIPLEFWDNSKLTKNVVLEIDKKCLSDVEEWLGIENVKEINGKHIASVNLPFDEGLVTKIMGFGDGIKVLEPTELKLKIKDVCLSIINNY